MACGSCQKRAKERAAQLKKQAERMKQIQESVPKSTEKKNIIPESVELTDANTAYFEAKMKLFWKNL